MLNSAWIIVALLLFPTIVGGAQARTPTSKAMAVLTASKRATGGAAWDKVRAPDWPNRAASSW